MSTKTLTTFVPLILLLVVMYFLLIRPQRKREKNINEMRNRVQVGDEIITIGGICGKVVKTKEESLVIQVGADKVKFEIMRWAVSKVVEKNERFSRQQSEPEPEEEEEAPKRALPKRMKQASASAEDAADDAVEEAADTAEEAVEEAADTAEDVAEDAADSAADAAEDAADNAADAAEEAAKDAE